MMPPVLEAPARAVVEPTRSGLPERSSQARSQAARCSRQPSSSATIAGVDDHSAKLCLPARIQKKCSRPSSAIA